MLIAQISDFHIAAPGQKVSGVASTADYLRDCIEHINQQYPAPDLVLITGDVSNAGKKEELAHAASLLQKLRYPYYLVPGNHDNRNDFWWQFSGSNCPGRAGDFIQYVVDDYALRLIALDTTVPGGRGGEICQMRARWLDQKLAEDTQKPCVIFMHHPPLRCGVLETDEDGFEGAGLLASVVGRHSHIERIVCGHIHLASCAAWSGTVVSTAPSTGMKLQLDLSLEKPSAFFLDVPAYQLHYWNGQQNLVTHTVRVESDADGPYLFS